VETYAASLANVVFKKFLQSRRALSPPEKTWLKHSILVRDPSTTWEASFAEKQDPPLEPQRLLLTLATPARATCAAQRRERTEAFIAIGGARFRDVVGGEGGGQKPVSGREGGL
jgi:hypothetical protein